MQPAGGSATSLCLCFGLVRHAPIRNFNCVFVYDFSQTMSCGEAGIKYFQELCPYASYNIGRVRGVKPSNVAAAFVSKNFEGYSALQTRARKNFYLCRWGAERRVSRASGNFISNQFHFNFDIMFS